MAAPRPSSLRDLPELLGLVDVHLDPARPAPRFHRDAIAGDRAVPAFGATGPHRALLGLAWAGIVGLALGGALFTGITHPTWLLVGILVAYVLENLHFVTGHVALHAAFVELDEPRMATITHHSFLHHYRRLRVYHETWLETRLSYFFCPRKGPASMTSWAEGGAQLATAALVATVEPAAGLALLSCAWLLRLLQSIVHEWYHNDRRRAFYWPTTWALLAGLERLGVISTRRHHRHHAHHLGDLDAVDHWVDMRAPGLDRLGDALWAWVKAHHVPGERRMLTAAARVVAAHGLLHYGALAAVFLGLAAALP